MTYELCLSKKEKVMQSISLISYILSFFGKQKKDTI